MRECGDMRTVRRGYDALSTRSTTCAVCSLACLNPRRVTVQRGENVSDTVVRVGIIDAALKLVGRLPQVLVAQRCEALAATVHVFANHVRVGQAFGLIEHQSHPVLLTSGPNVFDCRFHWCLHAPSLSHFQYCRQWYECTRTSCRPDSCAALLS